MSYRLAILAACSSLLLTLVPPMSTLAATGDGIISGTVTDTASTPIAKAAIRVTDSQGKTRQSQTQADGSFRFDGLDAGVYAVQASREGYASTTLTNVLVVQDHETDIALVLAAPSLTSIKVIGHIVTSARLKNFNSGIASSDTIDASTFIDQGQVSVQRILDQTPGIVTAHPTFSNAAVPSAFTFANIRDGLSYETSSLIDGHPVTTGLAGHFYNNDLSTYGLDDVELVKGPGAAAPEVNYAINGSVNYRTMDPSRTPRYDLDYGADTNGGQFVNFLASATDGRLGYVVEYYSFGSNGPLNNEPTYEPDVLSVGTLVNGKAIAAYPFTVGFPPGTTNSFVFSNISAFAGDYPVTSSTQIRSEIIKLRYQLSSASTLTAAFLGSSSNSNFNGTYALSIDSPFAPGSGYNGSVPLGTQPFFVPQSIEPNSYNTSNDPLFELEFSTRISNDSVQARYYTTSDTLYQNAWPSGNNPFTPSYPIYGTLSLCPKGTVPDPAGSGNCGPPGGPFMVAPIHHEP